MARHRPNADAVEEENQPTVQSSNSNSNNKPISHATNTSPTTAAPATTAAMRHTTATRRKRLHRHRQQANHQPTAHAESADAAALTANHPPHRTTPAPASKMNDRTTKTTTPTISNRAISTINRINNQKISSNPAKNAEEDADAHPAKKAPPPPHPPSPRTPVMATRNNDFKHKFPKTRPIDINTHNATSRHRISQSQVSLNTRHHIKPITARNTHDRPTQYNNNITNHRPADAA